MNWQPCFYNQRLWQQREYFNPQGREVNMDMIAMNIYPTTSDKNPLPYNIKIKPRNKE